MKLPESLHLLYGDQDVNSYKRMGHAIDETIPLMKDILERTEEAVQARDGSLGLLLRRKEERLPSEKIDPRSEEALLGSALLEKFSTINAGNMPWIHLLDRQVPLYTSKEKKGWGEIDLLGIGAKGSLLVVELKAKKSEDSPASALLQAAAYAVALRKHLDLITAELKQKDEGITLSGEIEIVLAAELGYWKEAGKRMNGGRGVPDDTSEKLELLRKELARNGLRSTFVAIDGEAVKGNAYAIKKCWIINRAESASC